MKNWRTRTQINVIPSILRTRVPSSTSFSVRSISILLENGKETVMPKSSLTGGCGRYWCESIISKGFSSNFPHLQHTLPSIHLNLAFKICELGGAAHRNWRLHSAVQSLRRPFGQLLTTDFLNYGRSLYPQSFHGRGSFPWKEKVTSEKSINAQINFPKFQWSWKHCSSKVGTGPLGLYTDSHTHILNISLYIL